MRHYLVLVAILLTAGLSYAGDSVVGNGGNVLVCEDEASPYHKMTLDLYELDHVYGRTHYFDINEDYDDEVLVNLILSKVADLNITFAGNLYFDIAAFYNDSKDTDDSIEFSNDINTEYPEGCRPKTIIEQQPNGTPTYLVSYDFYDLTPVNRVALIFHEVIYSYALFADPSLTSSDSIRPLAAYFFSKEFFETTDPAFIDSIVENYKK